MYINLACTVAILAQGTHWAVAVTQAFGRRLEAFRAAIGRRFAEQLKQSQPGIEPGSHFVGCRSVSVSVSVSVSLSVFVSVSVAAWPNG